jgi:hypothetical protein
MNTDTAKDENTHSLSYTFSPRETACLARFLRVHQSEIPDGLSDFVKTVENAIYNSMSIDEAEKFYS